MAESHNEVLKVKAKVLEEAVCKKDWKLVEKILKWLQSEPFSE